MRAVSCSPGHGRHSGSQRPSLWWCTGASPANSMCHSAPLSKRQLSTQLLCCALTSSMLSRSARALRHSITRACAGSTACTLPWVARTPSLTTVSPGSSGSSTVTGALSADRRTMRVTSCQCRPSSKVRSMRMNEGTCPYSSRVTARACCVLMPSASAGMPLASTPVTR